MNLIPDTLLRLKSKNFTPNMEHQIWLEENERSFIEWCRRDNTQRVNGVIPPSRLYERERKESFFRGFISPLIA